MAFEQLDLFGMMQTPVVDTKKSTSDKTANALTINENEETSTTTVTVDVVTDNTVTIKGKRGRKSNKDSFTGLEQIGVPDDEELRMKLYHPIRQVAKWFGVPSSQIRFWENQFEVLAPRKNRKGDRLFRFEDIQYLKTIYYLIRIKKYSIEGAREYLKHNKKVADNNYQIMDSLTSIRNFLLELKESLNYE